MSMDSLTHNPMACPLTDGCKEDKFNCSNIACTDDWEAPIKGSVCVPGSPSRLHLKHLFSQGRLFLNPKKSKNHWTLQKRRVNDSVFRRLLRSPVAIGDLRSHFLSIVLVDLTSKVCDMCAFFCWHPTSARGPEKIQLSQLLETIFTSWWLNQPVWKIWSSNWIISPGFGINITNIWVTTT